MIRMLTALRARLIDDACQWWRMWSLRFAAVMAALASYLLAAPETLVTVLNMLPPELRTFVPAFAGPALLAIITLLRLWKQGSKTDA
jgi:hypothetical protein